MKNGLRMLCFVGLTMMGLIIVVLVTPRFGEPAAPRYLCMDRVDQCYREIAPLQPEDSDVFS
jgi:hypothetical protein